jgi:hypothetical protein
MLNGRRHAYYVVDLRIINVVKEDYFPQLENLPKLRLGKSSLEPHNTATKLKAASRHCIRGTGAGTSHPPKFVAIQPISAAAPRYPAVAMFFQNRKEGSPCHSGVHLMPINELCAVRHQGQYPKVVSDGSCNRTHVAHRRSQFVLRRSCQAARNWLSSSGSNVASAFAMPCQSESSSHSS